MNLIVAVDKNWGIGYRGELLARVRADMKHFASLTTGRVVVLGSKTLSTFPGGKPLKNRTNIILSRREDFNPEGVIVVHSEAELFDELKKYRSEDVFIIGGASVYSLLLPYCNRAYVTRFDKAFEADAYFPDITATGEWELIDCSPTQTSNPDTDSEAGLTFRFCEYVRKK
ncbi:MAG: dihydrofolate reductase [Eubacteriales bacterium]|jgi:dihydrofolate reductase